MAHNSHDSPAERSSRVTDRNRRNTSARTDHVDSLQGTEASRSQHDGTVRWSPLVAVRTISAPHPRSHSVSSSDSSMYGRSQGSNQQRGVPHESIQLPIRPLGPDVPTTYTTSWPTEVEPPMVVVPPSVGHTRSPSNSSSNSTAHGRSRSANRHHNTHPPSVQVPLTSYTTPRTANPGRVRSQSIYPGDTASDHSHNSRRQHITDRTSAQMPEPSFLRLSSPAYDNPGALRLEGPHEPSHVVNFVNSQPEPIFPGFPNEGTLPPGLPAEAPRDSSYVFNSQPGPILPGFPYGGTPPSPVIPPSGQSPDQTFNFGLNMEHEHPGLNFTLGIDHHDTVPIYSTFMNTGANFITHSLPILPQETYHTVLLRLPLFYHDRVANMFKDLNVDMPELVGLALQGMVPAPLKELEEISPASANLKVTWEDFIDSLLREWKTLNIISALLLSAILTLLQLDGAGSDPITRNCALVALICALVSLLYGCIFIIRFASMRKTYTALKWAQMAQQTKTLGWWNIWVLLAMPAAWLAWSMILFIICIMTFSWRTGTDGLEVSSFLSGYAKLAVRIVISFVLALGAICFVLIMNTLRQYGSSMSKQFRAELERIMPTKGSRRFKKYTFPSHTPFVVPDNDDVNKPATPSASSPSKSKWFQAIKAISLNRSGSIYEFMPKYLDERGFTQGDWHTFVTEVSQTWAWATSGALDGSGESKPEEIIVQLLDKWNDKYFQSRATLAILCHESLDPDVHSTLLGVYIVDITPVDEGASISVQERLGLSPSGLSRRIVIPFEQAGSKEKSSKAGSTGTDGSPRVSTREGKVGSPRTLSMADRSHSAGNSTSTSSPPRTGERRRPSPIAVSSRNHRSRSPSRLSKSAQSRHNNSKN